MNEQEMLDFVLWHKDRMHQLGYPPEIVAELTEYRQDFIVYAHRLLSKKNKKRK